MLLRPPLLFFLVVVLSCTGERERERRVSERAGSREVGRSNECRPWRRTRPSICRHSAIKASLFDQLIAPRAQSILSLCSLGYLFRIGGRRLGRGSAKPFLLSRCHADYRRTLSLSSTCIQRRGSSREQPTSVDGTSSSHQRRGRRRACWQRQRTEGALGAQRVEEIEKLRE